MAQLLTPAPADDRLIALDAVAATLDLTPAWTLPGQAARWTGDGVDLVADDDARGGYVHVLRDDADATFGPHADPAEIATAVRAARSGEVTEADIRLTDVRSGGRWHTAYNEPHSVHGRWQSPPTCHASRAAEDRIGGVTALAGPGAASHRTWTLAPCDGSCER
ncbi:hypothetical protein H7X46_22490 [Pseudonocardia sp. C8]|uniref:hypothetical protein n=1 Tax=Pseudonocardia sp. C8 TaxID=2762759 RepID=UPI00164280F2|nr:hypothetical protein [Pseudonocardia sp. C8]MBC3193834.1 hypothetical protein [Pseudonocardia sp. C8]